MAKENIEIINDLLGYEGLKIIQRPDIFNFSLDSTVLASFVTIKQTDKKIIDMGCGNGYIPIFLTLRTKAKIIGVEIQKDIYDLAVKSVQLNNLQGQIDIYNMDLNKAHEQFSTSSFDVVVCNPPYFKYQQDSNTNESIYQTIARHEIYVTLEQVIKEANILLKDKGTFAMVHRAERLEEIIVLMNKYRFAIKKMRFVYPKENSDVALAILIEAKKQGKPGALKILKPLYVEDKEGNYTPEILQIFNYKEVVC